MEVSATLTKGVKTPHISMPRKRRTHMKGNPLGICAKCQQPAPERLSECGECCKARHREKAKAKYWSTPPRIVWQPFESSLDFIHWVLKEDFTPGTSLSTILKESGKWIYRTVTVEKVGSVVTTFLPRHEYQRSRLV